MPGCEPPTVTFVPWLRRCCSAGQAAARQPALRREVIERGRARVHSCRPSRYGNAALAADASSRFSFRPFPGGRFAQFVITRCEMDVSLAREALARGGISWALWKSGPLGPRHERRRSRALAPVGFCLQVRPVVKMRVTSPEERVVAGSNPAAGICARVAQG